MKSLNTVNCEVMVTAARAAEMYLPLWLRLRQHVGTHDFNIAIAR